MDNEFMKSFFCIHKIISFFSLYFVNMLYHSLIYVSWTIFAFLGKILLDYYESSFINNWI